LAGVHFGGKVEAKAKVKVKVEVKVKVKPAWLTNQVE
jgi:hypothetical protein